MLTDFIARLHPILVHFPIALLATAWLYEFARRRPGSQPRPGVSRACLMLGALGALAAAGSGWLAGESSSYARSMPGTLGWHRWIGVTLAACAVSCVVLGLLADAKKRVPYRIALTVTLGLVAVGGHLGGTLVHGPGFLTDAFRSSTEETRAVTPRDDVQGEAADETSSTAALLAEPAPAGGATASTPSYARDVAPLFEQHCLECHGPERRKAGLRLDRASLVELLATPGDPPIVVPGDADASELVRRIELPDDDLDRMPDKAAPLSAVEQALLRRWIATGARLD